MDGAVVLRLEET